MGNLATGSTAIASGLLTRHELRTGYRRIYRNVYLPIGVELTASIRAEAAFLWSDGSAVVCGASAAAVHGNPWISADRPAELIREWRSAPTGIIVHADTLCSGESTVLGGVQVTTHARTVFDIGRRVHTSRAVELIDVLLRNCSMSEVREVASRHRGARGIRRLMNVLSLADPGAESVQETRLRMCLVGAGLPRPETQIELCGPDGRTIRLDMGWREQRVAAEFDGAQHWGDSVQHRRDIERQENIASMGWRLVRVSRDQLINQPLAVVHRVRVALSAASRAA
ncbi:DUF559 domain-containing protein [Mycobacteroides chelonae]|jgi:hypothetical protein|uniref:DUF559 domain-containing protein n=1 Tax=Mycobacteroides chelonae TaxID=1774 RepID=UPI0008A84913|nr:DUF559 domain-containing protein [Mycobacteroides chelonae]MBF9327768.1 DUF559 domain-containing protein [Mycobacteroides chelonae]MBF9421946.1 DUF559 domain-containing protein [Mycobacteroides chelonae]MBF9435865.1 DUF559 domain-containing protein [Mycobacteroides chelonae]MBV6361859.1 DUF559 domain-containing protein [Mycobacteroides chelonae]MEC4837439.1 DUF559 domain-containing protein [Mycobacteroides chelonae]